MILIVTQTGHHSCKSSPFAERNLCVDVNPLYHTDDKSAMILCTYTPLRTIISHLHDTKLHQMDFHSKNIPLSAKSPH